MENTVDYVAGLAVRPFIVQRKADDLHFWVLVVESGPYVSEGTIPVTKLSAAAGLLIIRNIFVPEVMEVNGRREYPGRALGLTSVEVVLVCDV